MRVTIGDKQIAVYPFDDRYTMILRYSLLKTGVIPEYIRVVEPEFELKKDLRLTVSNVMNDDLFSKKTLPTLSEIHKITDVYKLSVEDVVVMWFVRHNPTMTAQLEKKLLEISNRLRSGELLLLTEQFDGEIQLSKDRAKARNTIIVDTMEQLNKSDKVKSGDPTIKMYQISIPIEVKQYDLLDIFDSISTSAAVPFVVVRMNGVTRFKVSERYLPEPTWSEDADKKLSEDGIYIKLLRYGNKYTSAYWNERNVVEMDFYPYAQRTEESIWTDLLASIGIQYTRGADRTITGVKAIFDIPDVVYNDGVFWDLVSNDPMVRNVLSIKEDERSVMNKEQRHLYYHIRNSGMRPVKIQLVVTGVKSSTVSVHISVHDKQQVSVVREVMTHVFSIYASKYQSIVKAYEAIMPDFMERSPNGATAPNPNKPGYRMIKDKKNDEEEDDQESSPLKALRQLGPAKMFSAETNYSKAVAKNNQPVIIPDDEFEQWLDGSTVAEKLKRVMRYPLYGDDARWYTSDDENKFPELQKNKKGSTSEEVPYFPQCLPKPHDYTTKRSSKYRYYVMNTVRIQSDETRHVKQYLDALAKIGIVTGQNVQSARPTKTKYTVRFESVAGEDRFGFLPRNISEMAIRSGVTMADDGLRLRRVGVKIGESSFLYCVAMKDLKFRRMSTENKDDYIVNTVIPGLTDMLADEAVQETAGETVALGNGEYVDPTLFIGVVQKYFNVNIFLYSWSRKDYHGEIVIPRNLKVYLNPGVDRSRDSMFVIIYEDSDESRRQVPQCNLIIHRDGKPSEVSYSFSYDKLFVKEAERMFKEGYKVRYLDIDTLHAIVKSDVPEGRRDVVLNEYIPIRDSLAKKSETQFADLLTEGVVSQFVDSYGKTRMLNYDNVSLMTPPIAPLSAPVVRDRDVQRATLMEAIEFLYEKNFLVVAQDQDETSTKGFWIQFNNNLGYIPLNTDNKVLEGVPESSGIVNDPISTSTKSALTKMRTDRKIAKILKQYVLYVDAQGVYDETDSYEIEEDHQYDISNLSRLINNNPTFYNHETKAIIVPSEDIRRRLHSYLMLERLNNQPSIGKLTGRTLLWNYYETPADFTQRKYEVVLDETGLSAWLDRKRSFSLPIVRYNIQTEPKTPYFYVNYRLTNRIMMVQNVLLGELKRALAVSRKWETDRVNLGYEPEVRMGIKIKDLPADDTYKYKVYTQYGQLVSTGEEAYVIKYSKDKYAAVLWLDKS